MEYKKVFAVFRLFAVLLPQTVVPQFMTDNGQEQNNNNIAMFLNNKIRQTLSENPEIFSETNLAAVFIAERAKLQRALITGAGSEEDFSRAEQALENFRIFAQKYKTIVNMLESALNDLRDFQAKDNNPLEAKYMALNLQTNLQQVANLDDAEGVLKQYAIFRATQDSSTTALSPGLAPGYGPYFEEIINILKNYFGMRESPQMANLLQQILANPNLIKQIYATLRGISDEDESEEDDSDYSWEF